MSTIPEKPGIDGPTMRGPKPKAPTDRMARIVKPFRQLHAIPGRLQDAHDALSVHEKRIATLEAELESLRATVAEMGTRAVRDVLRDRASLAERLDARVAGTVAAGSRDAARIDRALSLADAYARLRALAPSAFEVWRPLVDVNALAYQGFPVDSCSVKNHPLGEFFRCFVRPYWGGRALDVGCGPQPVPWYLEGYPLDLLHGIDPLGSPSDHPFHFVQGVAEFLPWADQQFSIVVVGTSLDHVLLLDQALKEIWRVLERPGGRALLWVTFIPGAPEYQPYAAEVKPIDKYHLFHFDRPWFERMIGEWFRVADQFEIPWPHNSVFYSLAPIEHPRGAPA